MTSSNYEDGKWDNPKLEAVPHRHPLFLQHQMQIPGEISFANLVRAARLLEHHNNASDTAEPDPIDYNVWAVNKYLKPMCRNAGLVYNNRTKPQMVAALSQWDKDNSPQLAAFATYRPPRPSKNSENNKASSRKAEAQEVSGDKTHLATYKKRKTSAFKDDHNTKRQKKAEEVDMEIGKTGGNHKAAWRSTQTVRIPSETNCAKQTDPHTKSATAQQLGIANPSQSQIAVRTRPMAIGKMKTPKNIVPHISMAERSSKPTRNNRADCFQVDLAESGLNGARNLRSTFTRLGKKATSMLNMGNLKSKSDTEQDEQQEDSDELLGNYWSTECEGSEDGKDTDEDEEKAKIIPRWESWGISNTMIGQPWSRGRDLRKGTHLVYSEVYSETEEEEARTPMAFLSTDEQLKRWEKIRQRNGEPEPKPIQILDRKASVLRRAKRYAKIAKAIKRNIEARKQRANEQEANEQQAKLRE